MKTNDIDEFFSVLSDPEIRSNCSICKRATKVNTNKMALGVLKGENRFTCKKCLNSIANRKYAFLYTADYLLRFNKKYFTVENIRRYVHEEFEHADRVVNNIPSIVRDLVTLGVVDIYNKQYNGHRYIVRNIARLQDNDVAAYAVIKGFGFKDGVKKESHDLSICVE